MAARPRPTRKGRPTAPAAQSPADERLALSTGLLIGLCAGLAAVYFALSFVSDGFYQHDEVAHYVGMRQFWHDPNSALGNWAKPGYKAIYAFPALLGPTFVALFNACVAAATVWAATRLAQAAGSRAPIVAFGLAALQPMWMALAFRNYSELPTALLLTLAVLMHYGRRFVAAALLLSFACTIRQEFYAIAGLYGLWLLAGPKAWRAALALALFPLLNHLWGWAATGEAGYLLTETLGFGAAIADAYPRQGFWHYFLTSEVIWGALPLACLAAFAVSLLFRQSDGSRWVWHPFIVLPVGLYFAAHVAFQVQTVPIGPATGGNLRYLTVIGPLIAVLGALGLERVRTVPRWALGAALALLTLLTALFLGYEHNNVRLVDERSAGPFGRMLLASLLLLVPMGLRMRAWGAAGLMLVFAAWTFRPFERTSEDAMMARVAEWVEASGLDATPLLVSHSLFHYTTGRAPGDYPRGARPVLGPTVEAAPVGTRIVWESHYSYRPQLRPDDVSLEALASDTSRFRLLHPPEAFITRDQRFGAFVFEKIAP
jgi:hypothetical protein